MSGAKVYLVEGKRTAFGKFGGGLMQVSPLELCLVAAKAILSAIKLNPKDIDHVVMGNVIPSTTDTIYVSRHLALHLGCGEETPAYNVNRLCGSGIQAIDDACSMIKLNKAECVFVGGVENMSMIPHLVYGSRFGTRYGPLKTVDMLLDTLTDKYCKTPMALTAEALAKSHEISRKECDQFTMLSHNRAAKAWSSGYFNDEVETVVTKRLKVSQDEHVRSECKLEDLAKLRSSFVENGVVTAATASGIVDGAACALIASEKFCDQKGMSPLAEIIDCTVVGVDPKLMGIGPVPAIRKVLEQNNLTVKDIDLFEINEAFASQLLACAKDLEIDQEKLNIWGGSIAIGHPLGATGTRIAVSLAKQLKKLNKNMGIASACIGGGQGIAILIKRVE